MRSAGLVDRTANQRADNFSLFSLVSLIKIFCSDHADTPGDFQPHREQPL